MRSPDGLSSSLVHPLALFAEFFAEDVRRTLFTQYGEEKLYGGGLSVRTTLDPVLQQVESFVDGTISANDCLRPVSRYWDRITRPEQLLASLPAAVRVLLDPADCGPTRNRPTSSMAAIEPPPAPISIISMTGALIGKPDPFLNR